MMSLKHVYPFVCLPLLIKDRLHGAMTVCQMTKRQVEIIHVITDIGLKH
jgi:hypothetical protein